MRKLVICLVLNLLLGFSIYSQSKNIFLNRDFWKSNPSIEVISQKIQEGNDIAELNNNAFDAVVYALLENVDDSTTKFLLTKEGNDINKITHDGRTYVFWAAYKGNIEMVQYLIDHGARMDIVDSHGYTPMNFVASTGQVDTNLFDLLLANGAKISDLDQNGADALLLSAPYFKDFTTVDYLVSKGANPSIKDKDGNGFFNYAAKGGDLEFLQKLIRKGYDYKTLNDHGGNAVMFASRGTRGSKNSIETYEFLKKNGLAINVVGKGGRNPLHNRASRERNLEIIQYFINEGVQPDLPDHNGNTPFMWASRGNSLEVIKLLEAYVKDINQVNKDGQSALSMALSRNSAEVCQFLIDQGANVNVLDKEGNSLAYYLIDSYRFNKTMEFDSKLQLLQQNGFEFPPHEGKGHTLYHLAVEKNDLNLVKRLNSFNLDVNTKNDDGITALHLAAMKAHNDEIMSYLISKGADKTILTDFEESVYDLASENELLQQNNIDLSFLK